MIDGNFQDGNTFKNSYLQLLNQAVLKNKTYYDKNYIKDEY